MRIDHGDRVACAAAATLEGPVATPLGLTPCRLAPHITICWLWSRRSDASSPCMTPRPHRPAGPAGARRCSRSSCRAVRVRLRAWLSMMVLTLRATRAAHVLPRCSEVSAGDRLPGARPSTYSSPTGSREENSVTGIPERPRHRGQCSIASHLRRDPILSPHCGQFKNSASCADGVRLCAPIIGRPLPQDELVAEASPGRAQRLRAALGPPSIARPPLGPRRAAPCPPERPRRSRGRSGHARS